MKHIFKHLCRDVLMTVARRYDISIRNPFLQPDQYFLEWQHTQCSLVSELFCFPLNPILSHLSLATIPLLVSLYRLFYISDHFLLGHFIIYMIS